MPNWLVVIIVIVALIVLYLISALILYLLMKRAMDKAYDALMELVPYERERLDKIIEIRNKLENNNFHISGEMSKLTDENKALLEKVPVDVSTVKNQTDFLIMYYCKFINEKKCEKRDPSFKEDGENLKKMLFLDEKLKDTPYKKYDKYAFRYNSFLNMIIIAPFVKRKYQSAPIL